MVHDARARHGEPQPFQERHLQRLARLEREDATAVENRNSAALEVDKVVARGEDRFAAPSLPRRRAHAVEDEGEVVLLRRRVEEVSSGVDPEERNLPPRQLRKERLEPVRVLPKSEPIVSLYPVSLVRVKQSAQPSSFSHPRRLPRIMLAVDGSAIILCDGYYRTINGKTAHGLVRGTDRYRILAVVDPPTAGQDA